MMFADILRKKKNLKDDIISEFLEKNSCSINNQFIKLLLSSDNYYLGTEVKDCGPDEEGENIIFNITTSIFKAKNDKVVYSGDDVILALGKEIITKAMNLEDTADDISDETLLEEEEATGLDLANSIIVSKKDLFPGEDLGDVIVVKNDDGSFLTLDGKILAIDHIDDKNISDVEIVAKDWYENAVEKINSIKETPVGVMPASEDEEEEVEEEESGEEE